MSSSSDDDDSYIPDFEDLSDEELEKRRIDSLSPRDYLYELLQDTSIHPGALVYMIVNLVAVFASTIVFLISSLPEFYERHNPVRIIY